MKPLHITLLTLFIILSPSMVAQQSIEQFVENPSLRGATVGISITRLSDGEERLSHASQQVALPASVLKLVTTATALELYGAEYRFTTQLLSHGVVDGAGTLRGDLVVVGSGNPSLGSRYATRGVDHFVSSVVRAVKEAGIKRVEGGVVAHAALLGSEGISPKWIWEDMGNYFAAGVYGLNYSDNSYQLTLRSGAVGTTPSIVEVSPSLPLIFDNHLVAANNRIDSAYIYGAPLSNHRTIYGSIPAHRSRFTIKGDIPNPPLYLAQALTDALHQAGVEVTAAPNAVLDGTTTPSGRELLRYHSDPLSHLVAITNQHSNNLYAEALLRLVAQKGKGVATATAGVEQVVRYWRTRGLDLSGSFIYDGSGLSPMNRISAHTLAQLLTLMQHNSAFRASLPVAGRSGTVRSLLVNTPLAGKLALKSGSMGGVQCYAGYYNNTHAAVILVNYFTGSRVALRKEIEQLFLNLSL